MFKKLQTHLISLYRTVAISILFIIIVGVLSYLFLLVFYATNSSWVAPVLLSPTQERVLAFQPQIATLELTINKQQVELETAKSTREAIINQLITITELEKKLVSTVNNERNRLYNSQAGIDRLITKKRDNINKNKTALSAVDSLLNQTDQELRANLITSDQAAQRKITLQGALNSATELEASTLQLEMQARQLKELAHTLSGGLTSITGLDYPKQLSEISILKSQLHVQLSTVKGNMESLNNSIVSNSRVIDVAKASPYYSALFEEITLAFVPYDNQKSLHIGSSVYSCYLQVILCTKVAIITEMYTAEEHAIHPLFKTEIRGTLIKLEFTNREYAKDRVLFVGRKPLFI